MLTAVLTNMLQTPTSPARKQTTAQDTSASKGAHVSSPDSGISMGDDTEDDEEWVEETKRMIQSRRERDEQGTRLDSTTSMDADDTEDDEEWVEETKRMIQTRKAQAQPRIDRGCQVVSKQVA